VTVTVAGYPARYKNFRRGEKQPFSVRQLPGGVTVISYDKNAFKAKLASDNVIAVQARDAGQVNAAPPVVPMPFVAPSIAPPPVAPPAGGEAESTNAPTTTVTPKQIGE